MEDNFYSLQFYCEQAEASWFFNNNECTATNDKRWVIQLTYEQLKSLIQNLNDFKTIIDYGKTTT